ncbi:MAG: hypothetical protein ACFCUW_08830 [Kiloniellaceae bacterium]
MMVTTDQARKAKEPSAQIFRREDRIIVHSQSKTTVGVWIAIEPLFILPMDASNSELGAAVLAALERSEESVPHPLQSELRKIASPLHRAAGVRSWRAFSYNTILAAARQQEQEIILVPYENRGPKAGFVEKVNQKLALPLGPSDEVGAKVREALALAS